MQLAIRIDDRLGRCPGIKSGINGQKFTLFCKFIPSRSGDMKSSLQVALRFAERSRITSYAACSATFRKEDSLVHCRLQLAEAASPSRKRFEGRCRPN